MEKVPDISYGVYLYGWPVENLIIWIHRQSPWAVFAEAVVVCCALGWLSWTFIESPALSLKKRLKSNRAIVPMEPIDCPVV